MPSSHNAAPLADAIEPHVPQSLADLKAARRHRWDWLWHGFLAAGNMTLLTSLWKAGKSTLISVLLARMKTGGTLAGLPVAAGRAVVISEESPDKWVERSQLLDLDGHVAWFCLPFTGTPTEEDWLRLLERIVRLHEEQPIALLVIDSLANLSPMRSENDAVAMLRPLKPLRRLTEKGVSILIAHHPKKGPTLPGQAARGSGALPGFVDIIVEMQPASRRPHDRRRLLRSFSRHSATPPRLVIEWTADGTDYRSLGTSAEPTFDLGWPLLHAILDQSQGPLARRDILRRWPESGMAPSRLTLWRWLDRAVQEGRVLQSGRGTRGDPFLYQLPGMAERWQQNFLDWWAAQHPEPVKKAPPSGDDQSTPPISSAPPPLPEARSEIAAPANPPPDPLPPPPSEEPLRLPYPWNIMDRADVPEEVWARAGRHRGWTRNG